MITRRAYLIVGFALSLVAVGCYETPKPNCAFLCGAGNACPEDYTCGPDGRCHLMTSGGGLAACEEPLPFDASNADAPIDVAVPPPDAGPDAMIDSGMPASTHAGLISIQDVRVQGHPELGHGGQVTITFNPLGPNDFDDRDATGVGCVANVYDLGLGEMPPESTNQGTVTITGTTAALPPCAHYMSLGYLCIAGGGMGGAGDMLVDDAGGPGTNTAGIVDAAPTTYTFSNADVGRYISITGAGAGNDGEFPIVAVNPATNTVIYGNPFAVTDTTFTGTYTIIAAAGPIPTSPEFLDDADMPHVVLDPSTGDGDFEAFDITMSTGDDFTLSGASQTAITSVSFTGGALTLECDPADCGDGVVSAVSIETTDGVIPPGAPDYFMPVPAGKVAIVQCAAFNTSITVSPGAMAVLASANPTRVQTAFFRDFPVQESNGDGTNRTNIIAGHGVIGFTSAPPPPMPDAGVPDAAIPDAAPPPDAALPPDADTTPDASPPDAFVCSPALAPTDDGSGAARQALMMSEINPGDYIELYNNTASPIDLDGVAYQFCSPFNYCALSTVGAGVVVPAGGYATVPWPTAASCFSSFTDTDAGGEVILYLDGNFAVDANIMDFVCWGTGHPGGFTRKTQAEATGKWTGVCASAITGGSIHRSVGTDGINAGDYNTSAAPSPMNCTP